MPLKALIAYDTRCGTTKTTAHWLSEGIAAECAEANMADVASLDCDLIVGDPHLIVGDPQYTPINYCRA